MSERRDEGGSDEKQEEDSIAARHVPRLRHGISHANATETDEQEDMRSKTSGEDWEKEQHSGVAGRKNDRTNEDGEQTRDKKATAITRRY